jgi:hypothetical protein
MCRILPSCATPTLLLIERTLLSVQIAPGVAADLARTGVVPLTMFRADLNVSNPEADRSG